MSVSNILKATLNPIAPTEADVYEGKEAVYITFNYNSLPADFGDDEPAHERFLIQVHLWAPAGYNTLAKRRAIKKALSAVATWPSYTNASGTTGNKKDVGQHHVFECELAQAAGVE